MGLFSRSTTILANQTESLGNKTTYFEELYSFIKENQFICLEKGGKRYFFFALGHKIYAISEITAGFSLFVVGYFGAISLRLLFQKYKLGEKFKKKFKQYRIKEKLNDKLYKLRKAISSRGGSEVLERVLHYEKEISDNIKNYLPAPLILNNRQLFVKTILKKCFQQNRFYLIVDRTLAEIVQHMVAFKKKDSTRIISYDALIYALWKATKPLTPALFAGLIPAVNSFVPNTVTAYLPLGVSIVVGIGAGVSANLQLGSIIYGFIFGIPGWYMSYSMAEVGRSLLLDCSDYRKELPSQELQSVDSFKTKKVTYTHQKPTHHDTFVSTSPGETLYYEESNEVCLDKIETLDGVYRESKQLNGKTVFTWQKDRIETAPVKTNKRYVPLTERTRTTQDLLLFNDGADKNAVNAIQKRVQNEQFQSLATDYGLE